MAQFNRGHMTTDMIGRMIGQLWENIKHKFKQDDDGLWYNSSKPKQTQANEANASLLEQNEANQSKRSVTVTVTVTDDVTVIKKESDEACVCARLYENTAGKPIPPDLGREIIFRISAATHPPRTNAKSAKHTTRLKHARVAL